MDVESDRSPVVVLRRAVHTDLAAVALIEQLSFVHAGERFDPRRLRYLIGSPRLIVTAAELDRKILGWSAGITWTRGPKPWGRIYALAVHPDARGRRLGDQLLQDMIAALRQRGAGGVFLEVRPDNSAAVRLYERNGFVTCRVLPNYYGPGRPAQRMVKAG